MPKPASVLKREGLQTVLRQLEDAPVPVRDPSPRAQPSRARPVSKEWILHGVLVAILVLGAGWLTVVDYGGLSEFARGCMAVSALFWAFVIARAG